MTGIAAQTMVTCIAALMAAGLAGAAWAQGPAPRRSGFDDMGSATQALQRDDSQNPAMLWVADGERLWAQPAGPAGRRCADCHGDAATGLRGAAVRYPRLDTRSGQPITLAQRINACRVRHQGEAPWAPESEPLLGLAALVARASRGLPLQPDDAAPLAEAAARGETLFRLRIGQLNLSCAQCHDERGGQRLGGNLIPQAHPSAYPIYRLEWQGLGSLQRRLRNCMTGVRAEVPEWNARDLVDLEAYLVRRAAGMAWEAPGVRP